MQSQGAHPEVEVVRLQVDHCHGHHMAYRPEWDGGEPYVGEDAEDHGFGLALHQAMRACWHHQTSPVPELWWVPYLLHPRGQQSHLDHGYRVYGRRVGLNFQLGTVENVRHWYVALGSSESDRLCGILALDIGRFVVGNGASPNKTGWGVEQNCEKRLGDVGNYVEVQRWKGRMANINATGKKKLEWLQSGGGHKSQ